MENIDLICIGTMEALYEEHSANKSPSTVVSTMKEAEEIAQTPLKSTKETLFYVQYPRIYPILFSQQPLLVQGKVIIHFVRHAQVRRGAASPQSPNLKTNANKNQAYHNLRDNPHRTTTTDPELTQLGVKQSLVLKETFTAMKSITHILCSPLTRTLQTAQVAFEDLISQGLKIVAYPDLREQGSGPSSTGTSLPELRRLLHNENKITDLSLVPKGWEINDKDCNDGRQMRAEKVRNALWELGQEALKESGGRWMGHEVGRGNTHRNIEILVVSHGAFLQKMLGLESKSSQSSIRLNKRRILLIWTNRDAPELSMEKF
jgi:broad specificity phosphatase PhoE